MVKSNTRLDREAMSWGGLTGSSLFDELEAQAVTDEIGNTSEELDEPWDEVPQARFLSWSHVMQLSYCYRRDLDAALRAESQNDAAFFLERADAYKKELACLKNL